jgi:hypothetical protein
MNKSQFLLKRLRGLLKAIAEYPLENSPTSGFSTSAKGNQASRARVFYERKSFILKVLD